MTSQPGPLPHHQSEMHWGRWALLIIGALALGTIFYAEENWRGKRAWERYHRELEERGQAIGWESFIPGQVPDDQNIFAAPNMTAWFVGRGGNALSGQLSSGRDIFLRKRNTNCWLELTIVPASAQVNPAEADLVLRYHDAVLELDSEKIATTNLNKGSASQGPHASPAVAEELTKLLRSVAASLANDLLGPQANSAQASFTIFVRSTPHAKPGRVIVRTDKAPDASELESLFPKNFSGYVGSRNQVEAELIETNRFRIGVSPPPYTAAADYLAWSDQFEPEFDSMREALKRPFARMNGDYQQPSNLPIPNFIALRTLAQTLTQRAQCHLLLEKPDDALRDLSLIYDVCRMLEGPPSRRPMTLLAAMIHVAITGLYVGVVEEGLRLEAWRAAQLSEIQEQLENTRLVLLVSAAFETERASVCRVLETITPAEFDQLFGGPGPISPWDRLRDPRYTLVALAPRGWIYPNMKTVAFRDQLAIDCLDRGLIVPSAADALTTLESSPRGGRFWAYVFVADLVGNSARAIQTTARNQTLVNEALVMCALERYRSANGKYPDKLEALTPQVLKKIPPDLIGGQPLRFHLSAEGKVVLYSVGWNGKDDGGVPGTKDPTTFDLEKGDWVWPYQRELIK